VPRRNNAWPIVRIVERSEEIASEQIPSVLREINDRQWQCVTQILVEAKLKAETMLRNDTIFAEPGRVAFYTGWLAYSDYVLSELERLREQPLTAEIARQPGPEDL
jgi:hypothetical protein